MSRLGKQPITLPSGVEATFAEGVLTVKGPKGTLSRPIRNDIAVSIADGVITFTPGKTDLAPALWGTYAAHAHNMIKGVTEGFVKNLELEGVGYRAEAQGPTKIKLTVGFSHPVELTAPEGVTVTTEKNKIAISGIDKDAVGQFAADVRKVKKPEPYKGKGIRYAGEFIIRKQGKKGVA